MQVSFILYSLFWSTNQVNMLQLQMVIAGYIYNYQHVITQWLISAMKHLLPSWLISMNCSHLACVSLMKWPFSEEWHIAVSPIYSSGMLFVNPLSVGIYYHALKGNQLVQLRYLSTIC
jgi:hypothetical protein